MGRVIKPNFKPCNHVAYIKLTYAPLLLARHLQSSVQAVEGYFCMLSIGSVALTGSVKRIYDRPRAESHLAVSSL